MKESIIDKLESLAHDDLVIIHNRYCEEISDYDNQIFDFASLMEILSVCGTEEIWDHARDAECKHLDEYYQFDGYGHIQGSSTPVTFVDFSDLADWLMEHDLDEVNEILE